MGIAVYAAGILLQAYGSSRAAARKTKSTLSRMDRDMPGYDDAADQKSNATILTEKIQTMLRSLAKPLKKIVIKEGDPETGAKALADIQVIQDNIDLTKALVTVSEIYMGLRKWTEPKFEEQVDVFSNLTFQLLVKATNAFYFAVIWRAFRVTGFNDGEAFLEVTNVTLGLPSFLKRPVHWAPPLKWGMHTAWGQGPPTSRMFNAFFCRGVQGGYLAPRTHGVYWPMSRGRRRRYEESIASELDERA